MRERSGFAPANALILGSVATFTVLVGVSVVTYPGGTWFDGNAVGYDPVRNFLCDPLHATALNGQPNPTASAAMTAAMICLVAGFVPMWWKTPALCPSSPRGGALVRWLGLASTALVAVVPLTPSDRFPVFHGIVVVGAAAACVVAGALAVVLVARDESSPRLHTSVGAAALTAIALDAALYVHTRYLGAPLSIWLPAIQKIATALVLVWMVGVALRARRAAGPSSAA